MTLLEPMEPYFASMAGATATGWGPGGPPERVASKPLEGMEVHVDISEFIDVEAEQARWNKERDELGKFVQSLEGKLGNENFVKKPRRSGRTATSQARRSRGAAGRRSRLPWQNLLSAASREPRRSLRTTLAHALGVGSIIRVPRYRPYPVFDLCF